MAQLAAPAPAAPVRARPLGRRSTPVVLVSVLVSLVIAGALAGAAALVGVSARGTALDKVREGSGPLTVTAQGLYRSLSDADATAAIAFLAPGSQSQTLRQQYLRDIADATAALRSAVAADPGQPDLAIIAARLPVYTGLVETARAYNRINLPVGAAYLREASALMRGELLTAAKRFSDAETDRLAADSAAASGFPWAALPLCVLLLVGLVVAQVWLTRRTNRVVNPGLAVASLLAVVLTVWLGVGWAASTSHLDAAAAGGSRQVGLLSQARFDVLRARADEALTLVARGNGAEYEADYRDTITRLIGDPDGHGGTGGVLGALGRTDTAPAVRAAIANANADVARWHREHLRLREADQAGRYADAVALAVGTEPGASSTASLFGKVDADLAQGIVAAHDQFDRQARAAAGALAGEVAGFAVLTILLLGAVIVGVQRRIAEYR